MTYLRGMPDADLKELLKSEPDLGVPFAQYHEVLLRGSSPFSVGERELMAAYVSGLNACDFCCGEHEAVAGRFGIEPGTLTGLLADIESAAVSEKLRPVFRYLNKLTLRPARMVAADVEAMYAVGWDDPAPYHAASVCALFSFDNRLIQGVGIPSHGAKELQETADRLHARGYASTVDFIKGR
ncbi:MAG: peroxidase [Gammaproteobacteria bacterium]|nr:peroxidase [Gammaproteobacteria bacterium]